MRAFQIISDDEVEAIHEATLRILGEVGVVLTHQAARTVLTDAGAVVKGDRVMMPPDTVEAALAGCVERVAVRGRGGTTITLGDGTLHWHNLGGARDVYDPATDDRRPATLADLRESTLLLDAMDRITSITPLYTPRDVPGHLMSLAMYRHAMPHTTKPLQGPGVVNAKEVGYAIRMAEVIGPPTEVLSLAVSPVSPLTFPDDAAEAIIAIAQAGIPFGPLPCPTAGTTAPMSLAGALAQQSAENLAAIVLAECVHPGLPVVYCGRLAVMEPRTGGILSSIEIGMLSAGTVQLGHRYNLPVNVYGFTTNAYTPEVQNGAERAFNALLPALAGADELSGVGEFGAGVISSHVQIVIDNELAGSVERAVRGFAVDADSLAVEVVGSVMDGARNYLAERHTALTLRAGGLFQTRLAERGAWEQWDREGREGMTERALDEVVRILAEHEVPPLTGDQERTLDAIMQAADGDLLTRR
jgi:trimethylamine--corrinoid protein Co-methyltransferase